LAPNDTTTRRTKNHESIDTEPQGTVSLTPARQIRLAYTAKETAALLGVSEKTVRRLVARGLLHASRALRHLLIPKKEIERFLQETLTL
jgi:excisionase family DNA binding protein